MNLVLARECSNSCPYCFETTEREEKKQNFISMENIAKLAAWARDSELQYLSLLGGEPFLHPKLGDIVTMFRQVCPGTELRVLTGGVFNKNLLGNISPKDTGLIFNINEPGDYRNPKHFNKVINNVETAIRKGFLVLLGFNVWRLDFDVSFMPALAHRLGRANFRWTVASPQWDCPSNVVEPVDYKALADRCFAMLQEAAKLNIEATLDCPLPLCFFSESQLAWVRQYHAGTASRMGSCEPVLDVTPELEVIRCFALSKMARVKLTDFPNENEIWHWFLKNVDFQLLPQGCFPKCSECLHFEAGRCSGGCLALHECIIDMEAQTSASNLILSMQEAINTGKPELALEQYEKANYWSKIAVPKFAAAIASFQLGKYEEAFRYASYAQDISTNPDLKQQISELMERIPRGKIKTGSSPISEKDFLRYVSIPQQIEEKEHSA